jgi:hypothetical protein
VTLLLNTHYTEKTPVPFEELDDIVPYKPVMLMCHFRGIHKMWEQGKVKQQELRSLSLPCCIKPTYLLLTDVYLTETHIINILLLLLLLAFTTHLRVLLASSFLRFRDHTQ